ncbi:Crp/Fnr family transcriptional regulator [Pyruvatibacter sp.]|uniref:Crp/Fnr family transcriptional regulator n=1 Tax=Pyruvatibacter sp. TaxID=1981328 RepID=UPI0032676F5A
MSRRIADTEGLIPLAMKGVQIISGWSDDARARLMEAAELREYAKGETVAEFEEKPDSILVLVRGALFNEINAADGKRLLLAIVRPGWILQVVPVWEGQGAPSGYTARTDALVMHIPADVFLEVANSDIRYVKDIATFACRIYRGGLLRINLNTMTSLRCQVASMLIFNTLSEFVVLLGVPASPGSKAWRVGQTDITQDELGSMIGYSRQKVNNVMKEMEAEGILRRNGRSTEITNYLMLLNVLEEAGPLNADWHDLAQSWQEQLEAVDR